MTVSVPDDKLNKILCLVELWLSKAVERSLNCSRSSENYHTFVHAFALDVFLQSMYNNSKFTVPAALHRDLYW